MSETEFIADVIDQAAHGEAWHGPALQDAVAGVTAEDASRRPIDGAHTIWEIVAHVTVWAREVERRLRERARPVDAAADWPTPPNGDADAWDAAKSGLLDAHHRLRQTIREFPPQRLPEQVPGTSDESHASFYMMLHGLAQHDAYHAGQIAMLRKALAAAATGAPLSQVV